MGVSRSSFLLDQRILAIVMVCMLILQTTIGVIGDSLRSVFPTPDAGLYMHCGLFTSSKAIGPVGLTTQGEFCITLPSSSVIFQEQLEERLNVLLYLDGLDDYHPAVASVVTLLAPSVGLVQLGTKNEKPMHLIKSRGHSCNATKLTQWLLSFTLNEEHIMLANVQLYKITLISCWLSPMLNISSIVLRTKFMCVRNQYYRSHFLWILNSSSPLYLFGPLIMPEKLSMKGVLTSGSQLIYFPVQRHYGGGLSMYSWSKSELMPYIEDSNIELPYDRYTLVEYILYTDKSSYQENTLTGIRIPLTLLFEKLSVRELYSFAKKTEDSCEQKQSQV